MKSTRDQFQIVTGWGLEKKAKVKVFEPKSIEELKDFIINSPPKSIIVRGLGRSYGDAAQLSNKTIIKLDSFKNFKIDYLNETITVGAGLSFSDILQKIIPKGFFLPVTPGTSYVTVGGAIAADVHGKNHHKDGSIGNHLRKITLIDGKGLEHELSPLKENKFEQFWATVGGMGLTGVIVEATIKLLPIETCYMRVDTKRFNDLDSLMYEMERTDDKYKYSVAWVDCLNKNFRGILTSANHAKVNHLNIKRKKDPLSFSSKSFGNAPNVFPGGLLNRLTIKAFNTAWFYKSPKESENDIQNITSYFHPLDGVKNWNKLYGPSGFLQYQFVVPSEYSYKIKDVLNSLQKINAPSFLTVLKRFGEGNKAPLSFPSKGWTLAVDIPNSTPNLLDTLIDLDKEILDAKGKLYLAKDSRQTPNMFKESYKLFNAWIKIKKDLDPDCKYISDISNRLEFFNNY